MRTCGISYVYTHVYIHIYKNLYIHIYIYIFMHIHMYVDIYLHIILRTARRQRARGPDTQGARASSEGVRGACEQSAAKLSASFASSLVRRECSDLRPGALN